MQQSGDKLQRAHMDVILERLDTFGHKVYIVDSSTEIHHKTHSLHNQQQWTGILGHSCSSSYAENTSEPVGCYLCSSSQLPPPPTEPWAAPSADSARSPPPRLCAGRQIKWERENDTEQEWVRERETNTHHPAHCSIYTCHSNICILC